jgi:hypothetical protein
MADREQPYDPYIPSGNGAPAAGAGQPGNQRTAALQAVSDAGFLLESDRWHGRWPFNGTELLMTEMRPRLLLHICMAEIAKLMRSRLGKSGRYVKMSLMPLPQSSWRRDIGFYSLL